MNKNVIYMLDAQWDDEYHKKEIAKSILLEKRQFINDEHVEAIMNSTWPQSFDSWRHITIRRAKKYAEVTNSDFVLLKNDIINKMSLPQKFSNYQKSIFGKFQVLKEFEKSSYDKMLFLDLDIFITNLEENIFEEYPSTGLYMRPDNNFNFYESCNSKFKEFFKVQKELIHCTHFAPLAKDTYQKNLNNSQNKICGPICPSANLEYPGYLNWFQNNAIYNFGVVLVDKEFTKKLNQNIPNASDWKIFLKEINLYDNPTESSCNLHVIDQDLLVYFLHISRLKVLPLPEKWNTYPLSLTSYRNVNFVHFFEKELINFFSDSSVLLPLLNIHKQTDFSF